MRSLPLSLAAVSLAAAAVLLPLRPAAAIQTPANDGPSSGWTVVVDAGHGGEDVGVVAGEMREAALALDLARRVARSLAAHGARAVLTRDADVAMDADQRAARANQAKPAAVVSLHFNRSPRPAATGAEIYTHEPAGRDDAAAPGTAPRTLRRWDLVQVPHVTASEALAEQVAAAFTGAVPLSSAGRQRVPLRLLAGVDAPAVLIEVAYLSNAGQAAVAGTPEFQDAVSEAVVDGLLRWRRGAPASAGTTP